MADWLPSYPAYDRVTELVTYQDAIARLLVHYDRHNEGRDAMLARQALGEAMLTLSRFQWRYYKTIYSIRTEAEYDTGTIEYTHSTKTVTLTDGTWPTNAARGTIVIDDVPYPVRTRTSGSAIVLDAERNPGDDVDSDTDYTWFRDMYPLPPDFEAMSDPLDMEYKTGGPDLVHLSSEALQSMSAINSYTPVAYPQYYSIERDPRGGKVLKVAPPPSEARVYNFPIRRKPRPLKVENYNTGTITSTSGSTAVVGVGTSWSDSHVGCVFRAGTATLAPTSQYGALVATDPHDIVYNPAQFERIVTSVTDATNLTLDQDPGVSASSVRYSLSDPLDVDWTVCGEYFYRLLEYKFAMLDMGIDQKVRGQKKAFLNEAEAFARSRNKSVDSLPFGYPWWMGWSALAGEHNVSTDEYAK